MLPVSDVANFVTFVANFVTFFCLKCFYMFLVTTVPKIHRICTTDCIYINFIRNFMGFMRRDALNLKVFNRVAIIIR